MFQRCGDGNRLPRCPVTSLGHLLQFGSGRTPRCGRTPCADRRAAATVVTWRLRILLPAGAAVPQKKMS